MANGVKAEWQVAPVVMEDHVLLYYHGGGFAAGSPLTHRLLTVTIGRATRTRVLSVDYRLYPEVTLPEEIADCFSAYKWLLSRGTKPGNIIIAGDSAGGFLVLATLLKNRDEKVPMPAAGICISPVVDLTWSGDSFFKNMPSDPGLGTSGLAMIMAIAASSMGLDPKDPALALLDAKLEGFPPLLFQVAETEMLFDDSRRFVEKAKRAGVYAVLQSWDGMTHGFQTNLDLPETKEAIDKIKEFVQQRWNS
ncbi:MAG: alpha/beta hydrolase [Candidatus Sigynarchaeota archaeon]